MDAWSIRDDILNADKTCYRVLYNRWCELREYYRMYLSENGFLDDWNLLE